MTTKLQCLFIALALLTLGSVAHAATFTWTNTAGGTWSATNNWSPNQVPGSSDAAVVTAGGTYTVTLDISPTVNTLTLGGTSGRQSLATAGQSFTLTQSGAVNTNGVFLLSGGGLFGNLTVNGQFKWTSGQLGNTSAALMVATNGVLLLAGVNGTDYTLGEYLTNAGTIDLQSGNLQINSCGADHGQLINLPGALVNIQSDLSIDAACGGTLANQGNVLKSGGTGITYINPSFNNSGTLDVASGTIKLAGGGTLNGDGTVAAGAQLIFAAGNFGGSGFDVSEAVGGQLNLMGGSVFLAPSNPLPSLVLTNGTLTLNGTVTNLLLGGGTLAGNTTIAGIMRWTNGVLGNSGTALTVAFNSILVLAGVNGTDYTLGEYLTNAGTIDLESGNLLLNGNDFGSLNNLPGGLLNLQADVSIDDSGGGPGVINQGRVLKTGGTGTSSINSAFNNIGILAVETGTVNLSASYTLTGGTLSFGLNSLVNFGKINLSGAAGLAGTVSASLNNGYVPIGGNSFAVLTYGSETGIFTNTLLPFADAWQTNYAATNFTLQVLNARPVIFGGLIAVDELTALTTNVVTNYDIPPQTLTSSLVSGPDGLSLNPGTGVISWTPAQTQSPSTNTVTVTTTDNGTPPLIATNSFTVVVVEVNVAPALPVISQTSVNELTLLTITNTANESNIHAAITGYGLITAPAGMSISPGGLITWTPSQIQSHSTNTVTTVVTNSDPLDTVNPALTATNSFTVIVKEVNVAPVLPVIAAQTVNELALLTVTNTATEANIHSTVGYSLLNPPAGVAISPGGVITWTPTQAEGPSTNVITTVATSTDTFDQVNPQLSVTNSFTVVVNEVEVNVAPVLPVIAAQTVNELTLLTVTNTATEANIHSTVGYSLLNPPAGVVISPGGVITWTPTQAESHSTNVITTVATSTNTFDPVNPQLSATNSFTVVVKEVNVAPVLPVIAPQTVNELALLTVTNTAAEANIHSTVGYSLLNPPAGVVISPGGVITWTPTQAESHSTNTITTVATSTNTFDPVNPQLSATNSFTVVVKEVNVAPVLPVIAPQTVNELALLTVTNTATEANIHSTVGYSLLNPPAGVAISPGGVITWTPTQAEGPSTNVITTVATSTNTFDQVNPQLSVTNSFTVVVNEVEVNVAPVLPVIAAQTVNELTLLTVTNTATEANIHSTVGYFLVSPPAGVVISPGGVITWTPTQAESHSTNVITTVATSTNTFDPVNPQLSATNSFTVVVKEVNVAPVLPVIAPQTVNELALLTVTNTAAEANIHSTVGYFLLNPPAGVVISPGGVITWTPTQAESHSTNTITTVATSTDTFDPVNPQLSVTNSFTVVVKEVNVAPVLPVIAPQTVNELASLTVTNTATDSNIHSTVGYSLLNPPAGVVISASGVITWTPTQAESHSTNTITTVATGTNTFDPVNPQLSVTNSFTVVVEEVNVAPVLPAIPTQSLYALTLLTLTNTATEPNIHATLSYSLVNPPTGASINTSGVITWTPSAAQSSSTNTITTIAAAADSYDTVHPILSATNSFTVIVRPPIVLTSATWLGHGRFQFQFNTAAGVNYTVEYSTNLINWIQLTDEQASGNTLMVTDTNASTLPRYYRVISP